MSSDPLQRHVRCVMAIGLICAAVGLAGCQTTRGTGQASSPEITGSINRPAQVARAATLPQVGENSTRNVAAYARVWDQDQGNVPAAMTYAASLRAIGQQNKVVEVLGETARRNPSDPVILAVYGKELAKAGMGEQASVVLKQAMTTGRADWSVYSAQGAVLDQMGRYAEARSHYEEALKRGGDRGTVLNNMGLSYALEGNLPQAEQVLTAAVGEPGNAGNAQLRQNLALVMGLRGNYDNARQVAGRDLPTNVVEGNMKVLKTIAAEPGDGRNPQKLSGVMRSNAG